MQVRVGVCVCVTQLDWTRLFFSRGGCFMSIAAEARVLTRLSLPYPTAGCMVLSTCSFDFTTSELTVLQ